MVAFDSVFFMSEISTFVSCKDDSAKAYIPSTMHLAAGYQKYLLDYTIARPKQIERF